MEPLARDVAAACGGCQREAFVLHAVADARLCDVCAEKSARIDRQLAEVRSDDPVACDVCGVRVDFDAQVAVITRGCGGAVLCDRCEPAVVEGARS